MLYNVESLVPEVKVTLNDIKRNTPKCVYDGQKNQPV